MKIRSTLLGIIISLFAAFPISAEDMTTAKGKTYINARITRVEPDGISFSHAGGIAKIPFWELPEDMQKKYGYDPVKATEYHKKALTAQAERRRHEAKAEEQRLLMRQANSKAVYYCTNSGLFYKQGRMSGNLSQDTIYVGYNNERDDRWLVVNDGSGTVDAERHHFILANDLLSSYAATIKYHFDVAHVLMAAAKYKYIYVQMLKLANYPSTDIDQWQSEFNSSVMARVSEIQMNQRLDDIESQAQAAQQRAEAAEKRAKEAERKAEEANSRAYSIRNSSF